MAKDTLNPPWQSLGHLLRASADEYATRTLFIYEGERLTYADAERRTNQLANVLMQLGTGKGERVSVMLPNGFDFPIAWLGIAKVGAVMVPTNTAYMAHDLRYILSDSGARAIIIHADYLPRLQTIRADLPALEHILVVGGAPDDALDLQALMRDADDSFNIDDVAQDDLLNIQYTSGTTGFPKGCMLTHGYWLMMGMVTHQYLAISADDVDLTAQPFYYMDPQWNTVACMIGGIALVIMPRFSVSRFWQTVNEYNVTFLYMLGTMPFYLMKREPDDLERNHRLRVIACSGIVPDFHATFEERFNVPWREAFGMTETGVDLLVPLADSASVGTGAMGAPIPTKEARVINEDNEPVPDGTHGELVVRGQPMMLGYWNKPEQTAEILRDGWLHTGDIAYKDERGYFHWVGRLKDMVRRSGENIASSEVESVLVEHPAVMNVAVVPVPDELRGEEVKAYIQLKQGETPQTAPPQVIIGFAESKLAKFKLPRYIEYVDSFPLTPSERIAKHELIKGRDDLRTNSYDNADGIWR